VVRAPLTREIEIRDEFRAARAISMAAERAMRALADKRDRVTLMTLGTALELLALGYLSSQRVADRPDEPRATTQSSAERSGSFAATGHARHEGRCTHAPARPAVPSGHSRRKTMRRGERRLFRHVIAGDAARRRC
jgi:formate dehydrogenase assembly factor FdhD